MTEISRDYKLALDLIEQHNCPIEIEIGSNNGVFLCSLAKEEPFKYFIGVEIDYSIYTSAVDLANRKNVRNLLFINADARRVLSHEELTNKISAIHIYFPNPYLKEGDTQTRLVDKEFAIKIDKALIIGGLFRFATDSPDYFEQIYSYFQGMGYLFSPWISMPFRPPNGLLIGSHFENRFSQDREIYYCCLLK